MQRAGISEAPFELIGLINEILEHSKSSGQEGSSMDVKSFSEHMDKRPYDRIVRELNIKAANSVEGSLKKLLKKYQDLLLQRREDFQCQTNFDGVEEMAKLQRIQSQLAELTWENQGLEKQLERIIERAEKYEQDYKDLLHKHKGRTAKLIAKEGIIMALKEKLEQADSKNRDLTGRLLIGEAKIKRILDDYHLV